MHKTTALLALCALSVFGKTAETVTYRAVMSPANEVPAITGTNATGVATLRVHVVRDDGGQVESGSVDFLVSYSGFPADTTFTGLHIHGAPAGVNGDVLINTGLSGTNTLVSATGAGTIDRQAPARPDQAAAVAALRGILANPSQYYANLHTTVFPGGVIRGQLQRTEQVVLMGFMSTRNEVDPPPALANLNASGLAAITAIRSFDDAGNVASAQVVFDINYSFPETTTFTGLHIHNGPAGVNAGVVIPTVVGGGPASVQSAEGGTGSLSYPVEINFANQAQKDALNGLFSNPAGYYANLHTTQFGGGAIRAQLRTTDRMTFPVEMSSAKEVAPPAPSVQASGTALLTVYTLRQVDGDILTGRVVFDVNYRFPGRAEFSGLHIHNGIATVNGGVTINTGLSGSATVVSETGIGNIMRAVTVNTAAGLATLNSLVANPERHYVNLHTLVDPGGVIRSQLATGVTGNPSLTGAASAAGPASVAPAGLISIYGGNLAAVGTNLDGWAGDTVPAFLNGVQVTIGGKSAPIIYVSPGQINAQVPVDVGMGAQQVVVNNGTSTGPSFMATVAAAAPALFTASGSAVALKSADSSLVTSDNPAGAGDILLIYATGLGQTRPPLATGAVVGNQPPAETGPVTVSIGGQNADVMSSIAAPGSVGVYQVTARMPAGVAPGNAAVVMRMGAASSNTATLAVR
ncbi:MAG: CHRD domain-containing protein [Acidobacteria bacterium]|nr:CHRD domain-containing protein [Acidobacteriota bacterium]